MNAIYTGSWLTDVKKYYSKAGCTAVKIGDKLLFGKMIRQEYLETAIEWVARTENTLIEGYISEHQHDMNATPL
ncbi:MAG: hypothetical protein K2J47_05935 [Ruminococcus sp.]|nr:hypothetical protein [Ruminococcus sp.]